MVRAVELSPLELITEELGKGEDRDPDIILGLINEYYASRGKPTLLHLDDVEDVHATSGLGNIFGFEFNRTEELRDKLVAYGIFSLDLSEYSSEVQNKVIRGIIGNFFVNNKVSSYLGRGNKFRRKNGHIIASSELFRDFIGERLSKMSVTNLDAVRYAHATKSIGDILGFKPRHSRAMKRKLVAYNIFSPDLSAYSPDVQNEVIVGVIDNISTNKTSFYLARNNHFYGSNRRIITNSPLTMEYFMDYFSRRSVLHLDAVGIEHATKDNGKLLGFNTNSVEFMRNRLVEIGVFSSNLSAYARNVQNEIIDGILGNNFSGKTSFYLSDSNPHLEKNRRLIAASVQMRKYLAAKNMFHLDDLRHEHATDSFARILGFKAGSYRGMLNRIADLGLFPMDLSSTRYDSRTRNSVIEGIINNIDTGNGLNSFYIADNNPFAEKNREQIVKSRQMQDYLFSYFASKGIVHLCQIKEEHATKDIGKILGFKEGNYREMQKRLVEFGYFSQDLSSYSNKARESVIDDVIKYINGGKIPFYLFNDNPYLESNRRVIAASSQMRDFILDYFSRKGVLHLDAVEKGHATERLGRVLGFKRYRIDSFKRALSEYGILSQDLSTYSPKVQGQIIEGIIKGVSTEKTSFYLRLDSNPYLESNRKIIAQSDRMKEYLAGIDVYEQGDVRSHHATSGLGGILGFPNRNGTVMKQRLIELGGFNHSDNLMHQLRSA